MIKNNKWKVIISSLIILIPILVGLILWDKLPDTITTHWGADGNPDGFSRKIIGVFLIPIISLVLQFVALLLVNTDKKQREENKKVLELVFWIVPFISLFSSGIIYSAALEKDFYFPLIMPVFFGLLLIFMGIYIPKIKQNPILGIKVSWTLSNEENWNRTHRFSGKLWLISGFILLFSVFLPHAFMIPITVSIIIAIAVIPMAYSYCIYRKDLKNGVVYVTRAKGNIEKITMKISGIILPIILIAVVVLMFTGNVHIHYGNNSFKIDATYLKDLQVQYSEVDSIEYREDLDRGIRTNGFGSPRLSLGTFRNDDFGTYTVYTYTNCKSYIVLEVQGKILVIGGKDVDKTKEIYEVLSDKIKR